VSPTVVLSARDPPDAASSLSLASRLEAASNRATTKLGPTTGGNCNTPDSAAREKGNWYPRTTTIGTPIRKFPGQY
jgi:hypothetical protein